MKYFYIVIAYKDKKDQYYAEVECVSDADNIMNILHYTDILHANIAPTKKRAYEIADAWNNSYRKNGTYAFA